jgi:transcriptional regulator with XRE-family HTH domain
MLISERVQMVIKMHNLSPSLFADQIGVQRSNVSHVLSGRSKPGLDFLEKILLHFPRVNAHWLITGEMKDDKGFSQEKASAGPFDKAESEVVGEIDKIVVFYRNGTFKSYSEKNGQ